LIFNFFKKKPPAEPVQIEPKAEPKLGKPTNADKIRKLEREIQEEEEFELEKRLRLAMLLQKEGRVEEGFGILAAASSSISPDSFFYFSDRRKVADKMRLFLQREGKHIEAVCRHVDAYLLDARHDVKMVELEEHKVAEIERELGEDIEWDYKSVLAGRREDAAERKALMSESERIREYLLPALKKAGKLPALEEIEAVIQREMIQIETYERRMLEVYGEVEIILTEESFSD
jgi:hypothetical protein